MEPIPPVPSKSVASNPPPDKRLFTPGPITTSPTVKQAMLHDAGSRDHEFTRMVREIRAQLLRVAGLDSGDPFEAIPIQGSGTFAVEAVLSSAISRDGQLLVIVNGAYGRRMVEMAARHKIPCEVLESPENQRPDPASLDRFLDRHANVTHVAAVHCETTTGILNPIPEIGAVVAHHRRCYIVDAMSSFGAIPLDLRAAQVSFLISSANKCIEGVPGFAFVLARRDALQSCAGQARTLSLDLFDQWQVLERTGQFRFTPPTHVLLAFAQALRELDEEGGPAARSRRYQSNQGILIEGMRNLGFSAYLPEPCQSCIITTFHYPRDPQFKFTSFYESLSRLGFVIYPGKLSHLDCFRIGTIGRIYPTDIENLLKAISVALKELGCSIPVQ